jgi:hypothetical protein
VSTLTSAAEAMPERLTVAAIASTCQICEFMGLSSRF